MRLIDGDALCVHIEEEFDGVCVYDVSGNEAAREFCDMVDIAPTIDAIPIEWMASWIKRHPDDLRCAWFVSVEMEWLKEQGART